jgi:uncharacterized protein
MDFRWNDWNLEHVAAHGVEPEEAEWVVEGAVPPHPEYRGEGKWAVWGRGIGGRFLQVIFVREPSGLAYIIHARPLTDTEKRRFRRREGL